MDSHILLTVKHSCAHLHTCTANMPPGHATRAQLTMGARLQVHPYDVGDCLLIEGTGAGTGKFFVRPCPSPSASKVQ